uniref:Uncharacterized protein n=1 Tax=Anguilla anguilla TaxID=7936 RepID=A0A0E9SZK8_ANGAN
MLLGLVNILK